jgi:hypothetical protein
MIYIATELRQTPSQVIAPWRRQTRSAAVLIRLPDLFLSKNFPKPPRMRWSTYWRLDERNGEQCDRWTFEFVKRLGFRP